jgi:hypothetical protein
MQQANLVSITVEEIANLFSLADQDHNGKLSFEEIASIMTTIKGTRPADHEIQQCMRTMDSDGDGVINEQEFLHAMTSWLEIVNKNTQATNSNPKKRSHDTSPLPVHRKKTISDMTNFFRQFSAIPNFEEEQRRILIRDHNSVNLTSIHREYLAFSPEDKLQRYELIKQILADGREVIVQEINSFDWSVVLSGINKVQTLLAIVELFPTPEERFSHLTLFLSSSLSRPFLPPSFSYRFDFSSTIFQIFDGVSQADAR